jgi:hypothetical protein
VAGSGHAFIIVSSGHDYITFIIVSGVQGVYIALPVGGQGGGGRRRKKVYSKLRRRRRWWWLWKEEEGLLTRLLGILGLRTSWPCAF